MTDDRMALIELIEKGADSDLVREMLAFAAERLMEAEVGVHTGATMASVIPLASSSETAIASAAGILAQGGSTSRSPGCAKEAISRRSWSHGAPPRRR